MHVNNSAEFIDENPKLSPCGMGKNRHAGNRKDLRGYFIRPFLRREAVLSSRIEGTQTTLGELLAAEAGAMGGPNSADLREVGNYVAAVEYGLERLDTLPLSLRLIRSAATWRRRGKFRRSQNWIGPPGCGLNDARYVGP